MINPFRRQESSPSGAAVLLLVWQEPTDRALAGWCPSLAFRTAMDWDQRYFMKYVSDLARVDMSEEDDLVGR